MPDDVSKKSLKVLDQKLQWLAEHAEFDVTVNSVVGGGIRNPDDALTIAQRARELGFSTTVGIIHDGSGQLLPLDERAASRSSRRSSALGKSAFDFANYNRFQKNLANGQPNDWHCRAGARYLYVCEDGLVHWCSQQRGHPGIPLERYTRDDLEREYHARKRARRSARSAACIASRRSTSCATIRCGRSPTVVRRTEAGRTAQSCRVGRAFSCGCS